MVAVCVVTTVATACTEHEPTPQDPRPVRVDVQAEVDLIPEDQWQSTSYVIAGDQLSLLVDKENGRVSRIAHADGHVTSAPHLPSGLEPYDGAAIGEDYYVFGQTCPYDCGGTLVRWRPGDEHWIDVPVHESFRLLDSAVDTGVANGRFYMATGNGGAAPAMYVLDDRDDSWHPVAQPQGLNGGNASICSTGGEVYRFFGFGSPGDSATPPGPTVSERKVWALRADDDWDEIEVPELGAFAAGLPAQDTLCTGGSLLLALAADGTTIRVRRDDEGELVQDTVALPEFERPSDRAFPAAAMSKPDGSIFGGPDATETAPWQPPADSHLLSSDQRDGNLTALVATPDGVQVWIWPVGSD